MENNTQNQNLYDLIIVGGGPAGSGAAVYAARKRLKTLLITKEWGGQSITSSDIQNWLGTINITGEELAKKFQEHVEAYKSDVLDIKSGSVVEKVEILKKPEENIELIQITLDTGDSYIAKALLITTGSNRKELTAKGAKEFENKGLTYCASCDGPMFSDMDVVVVGGGNAGFESAAQLLAYCKSVTLLSRSEPRAEEIMVNRLLADQKFKLIKNTLIEEIHGETFVSGITYKDKNTNEITKLDTNGIFVEVGQIPNTDFVSKVVELNQEKKIVIDPWTGRASQKHLIWAAGDATNILYQQNNIAAGEAIKAVEDIYKTLKTK